MPAFPIPGLPSLDSFRSFIDTSPPVFYPAEAANHVRPKMERRRSDHTLATASTSYPASAAGSHLPGRSRSRSTTGVTGVDSPLRRSRPDDQSVQSQSHTHTHTRAASSSSGTLMPANASAIDLDMSGEWEPLSLPPVAGRAGAHLARRNSTGARPSQHDSQNALSLTFEFAPPLGVRSGSSPGRPGHRRSHSEAPAPTPALALGFALSPAPPPIPPPGNRRTYAPFGRLREFSRNPLASTSAVSLPTLVELDGPNYDLSTSETIETMSERGSPLVRPRNRRLSKASAIAPASPLVPARSPPMSPLSVSDFALPPVDSSDSDESGEMGQPEPLRPLRGPSSSSSNVTREIWQASSVPPPQAVGGMRPRPPARSWSQDLVDLRPSNTDPLSLFASSRTLSPGRRHSVTAASSSVSDVAVLATWSFPSSPDREPVPTSDPANHSANPLSEPVSGRSPDRTSRRLKERLRTLSQLDTTILPGPEPLTGSESRRPEVARSNTTVRPPLRPFLAHRHTHSSPSLLLPTFVPPNHPAPPHLASTTPPIRGTSSSPRSSPTHTAAPTRHARRPTTSRLRNPAPLSMPCSTPNPITNTNTNPYPNPAIPNPLFRPRSRSQSQSQSQPQPQPQPQSHSQSQSQSQVPSIQSLPPEPPRVNVAPQGDRGERSSGLSLAIRLDLSRSRSNTLSFSPGSLTDDSTSASSILCPSPTASIVSLSPPPPPPPPHLGRDTTPGAISTAAAVAIATRDNKEVWWKRWGSRRRSVVDHAVSTLKTSIEADIAGLGIHDMSLDVDQKITKEEDGDGDGDRDLGIDTQISLEEEFLDFDDI